MSQIIGNPSRGTGGHMLGLGPGGVGQVMHLFGAQDPNTITDGADTKPGCVSACPGSLFMRTDTGQLYVKQTSGAWSAITVP